MDRHNRGFRLPSSEEELRIMDSSERGIFPAAVERGNRSIRELLAIGGALAALVGWLPIVVAAAHGEWHWVGLITGLVVSSGGLISVLGWRRGSNALSWAGAGLIVTYIVLLTLVQG